MLLLPGHLQRTLATLALCAFAACAQTKPEGTEGIEEALAKVQVLGSALMIGAHPDDENTAVLAWLARSRHVRAAYLSLTRGEGGQNLIGSEQGDALGLLRTQELLNARRIDGAEQFFTRAIDFGFSKSPKESIDKWGHDAILSDIVWVIREFEPDVVILRFSGTPKDGHGHHQASAILGKEAYEAAGDASRFPEQLEWVKPWKAKRLIWNAFSFTEEQKKSSESLPHRIRIDAGAFDPILGCSFEELAALSRSQHRSQGMGVPQRRGPSPDYFVPVEGEPATKDIFDGVDTTWGRVPEGAGVGELLKKAAAQYVPQHPEKLIGDLAQAAERTRALAERGEPWATTKLAEIENLMVLCSGTWADATADRYSATQGETFKVTLSVVKRLPVDAIWTGSTVAGLGTDRTLAFKGSLRNDEPEEQSLDVRIPESAPYSQPFWLSELPQGDRYVVRDQRLIGRPDPLPVLTAIIHLKIAGADIDLVRPVHYRYVDPVRGELMRPIVVVPPVAVDLPERAVLFPNDKDRSIVVQVRSERGKQSGDIKLVLPNGWSELPDTRPFSFADKGDQEEATFLVKPPATSAAPITFRASAMAGGREINVGMQWIEYEHIEPQVIFRPAAGKLEPIQLSVLAKSVGYVMGAGDAVPDAIRQMGCEVRLLGEADLLRGDLSKFDAIVIGVRAYNVRLDVKAAESRLLEYVRNGGTLIVQYNVLSYSRVTNTVSQPGFAFPFPLEISNERVVDETSPIRILDSRSPLLATPNQITPADFGGWVQERGLYFAHKWDAHYSTLLGTHDPGENELAGGLLYARYGKGVYIFTAYSWFRELPAGVPGAYRLFANLLSAGRTLGTTTTTTVPTAALSGSTGH